MKVPVAKIIQLVFEIGVPGVREIIAIWRKGGELTLDEAEALVGKFEKKADDYLRPTDAEVGK